MKKVLLAGTALVAVAVSGGAASAAEKITLHLGGYSKWWVAGVWNNDDFQAGAGTSYNNVDVKGDNEVHFLGSTTLDNGIKIGVAIEMEAGGHVDSGPGGDHIDASYAYIESGFGKVQIGSNPNAAYLMHVTAPDAAANIGADGMITGGYTLTQPTTVSSIGVAGSRQIRNTTAIYSDDKSEKLTYISPAIAGLSLGASYVPNWTEDDRNQTPRLDTYVLSALFAQSFGGIGIKASGGYAYYDPGALYAGSQEFSLGGQASYAGFTVGGSYRNARTNLAGGQAPNPNNLTATTVVNGGEAWDAGLQYALGTYAVSFYYFHSRTHGIQQASGDDKIDVYQVSGKYTLGPGVDLLATAGYADFQDGDGSGPGNSNNGWVVTSGLSLTF